MMMMMMMNSMQANNSENCGASAYYCVQLQLTSDNWDCA